MELQSSTLSFAGGMLIGLAAVLLYWFNGRIAGISGILTGIFGGPWSERLWRMSFIAGLVCGGYLWMQLTETTLISRSGFPLPLLAVAGLLVGYGTHLGNGCTSGHGVCGISRLSMRSMVATGVFMVCAIITTAIVRHVFGVGL